MHTNDIENLIPKGKANKISMAQLCNKTGKGKRFVSEMISNARVRGTLIISDRNGGGYYQPDPADPDFRAQLLDYYHTSKKKAKTILRGLRETKRILNEFKGQRKLFREDQEEG